MGSPRALTPSLLLGVLLVAASLGAGFALGRRDPAVPPSVSSREPELARYMTDLQHHTHKVNLSVEARNQELASFYLHELGEVVDEIIDRFPEHDGFPVGKIAASTLQPRLQTIGRELADRRWTAVDAAFADLLRSCNACHATTGHPFLRVAATSTNPFNQSFE